MGCDGSMVGWKSENDGGWKSYQRQWIGRKDLEKGEDKVEILKGKGLWQDKEGKD